VPVKNKNILYLGWLGYGNIGDDLLYDVFKKMVLSISPDTIVNYYCPLPNKKIDKKNYDLVVLGGGSLLGKYIAPSTSPFVLFCLELVKEGIPLAIWGSGLDLRSKEYTQSIISNYKQNVCFEVSNLSPNPDYSVIVEHSQRTGVRGNITKYLLNSTKVEVIGDAGIIFDRVFPNIPDFQEFEHISPGNKLVLINWGTSFNRILGQDEQRVEDELKKVVDELLNDGYEIVIYPVWGKDIAVCKEFAKGFSGRKLKCIDKLYNVFQISNLIKKCRFTINFKLHANILSMAYQKPFICLSYGLKGYDFCDSINSLNLCLPTDSIKEKNILEKINHINSNYNILENKYRKFINVYHKKHLDFISNIVQTV
jgi:polysaccharide pyruvyl transferase WcaK-like protein